MCVSLTLVRHYQTILETLFVVLSQNQPPRVVDNICGAVSRMMMANRNSLPLEKVCVLSLAVQNNMQAVGTNILDFCVGYPFTSACQVPWNGAIFIGVSKPKCN